ncbi:MAG: hypothetical protein FJY38_05800 [Betaproteobacteria bacterium]|nr:hypothetical protein [Betaproteobacteria bacterium]
MNRPNRRPSGFVSRLGAGGLGLLGRMIGRPQLGWLGLEKWLLVGILVLQVPMWFGAGGWPSVWKLEAQVEEKKLEIAAQRFQIEELEAEVKDLQTGLQSAEERARYEMGLMRPGERFVQIVRTP